MRSTTLTRECTAPQLSGRLAPPRRRWACGCVVARFGGCARGTVNRRSTPCGAACAAESVTRSLAGHCEPCATLGAETLSCSVLVPAGWGAKRAHGLLRPADCPCVFVL